MNISFQEFIKELIKYKLILLGEIHGTKEIPYEIKKIITSLTHHNLKKVFFEAPIEEQKYLDDFIKTGSISSLNNIPSFKYKENSDGRNSKEYLDLIEYLRSKKTVKIFFVDSIKGDLNKRDLNIYKNIKKLISKDEGLSIFITGNIHAYTEIINLKDIKMKTTGYYLKKDLKDKLASVNFIPANGNFYNLGLKKINKKYNLSKITIKRTNKGYEYDYLIPKVSPCSFMH